MTVAMLGLPARLLIVDHWLCGIGKMVSKTLDVGFA